MIRVLIARKNRLPRRDLIITIRRTIKGEAIARQFPASLPNGWGISRQCIAPSTPRGICKTKCYQTRRRREKHPLAPRIIGIGITRNNIGGATAGSVRLCHITQGCKGYPCIIIDDIIFAIIAKRGVVTGDNLSRAIGGCGIGLTAIINKCCAGGGEFCFTIALKTRRHERVFCRGA